MTGFAVPKKAKPGKRGRRPGGGDDLTSRMTEAELDELVESRRGTMPAEGGPIVVVPRGKDRHGKLVASVDVFAAAKFGRCAVAVSVVGMRGRQERGRKGIRLETLVQDNREGNDV